VSGADSVVAILESETRSQAPLRTVLQILEEAKRPLAKKLRSEALALKILNVLLCRHQMQTRSDVVLSRPLGLILDPVNACQMSCPGCVHSATAKALFDWKPGRMSMALATSLFRQYGPYTVQAAFYNYGEPTLNTDTPRMIGLAKRYQIYTTMSSNLARRRLNAEEWVGCGLDFLIVSIDGVTPAVHNIFRRNGDHQQAFANLRSLIEAKRRLKLHTPVICWLYLAFEHNKHEIPAAVELARKLGVNQISIAQPYDVSWDDPSIRAAHDVAPALYRFDHRAARWLAENELSFPLDTDRIHEAFEEGFGEGHDSLSGSSNHTCSWLYKNMALDANGRIFPCCASPRPDARLEFGQFGQTPDPFNSAMYQAARRHFIGISDSEAEPYCTRCTWNQERAHIDHQEVRHCLRAVGAFSSDTLNRLTSW
jgi:MoaA/NifB/PqqE/SkfB family radical SAM enzyme